MYSVTGTSPNVVAIPVPNPTACASARSDDPACVRVNYALYAFEIVLDAHPVVCRLLNLSA
eukprot:9502857-Pyramimonas_sp.AAC.2